MSVVEFERPMDRRSVRARLFNPPNGRKSDEREIVAEPEARRRRIQTSLQYEREERERRKLALAKAYLEAVQRQKQALEERRQNIAFALAQVPGDERDIAATAAAESAGDTLLPPPPRFSAIMEEVCRRYSVTSVDLISSRRTADIVLPRQITSYLARHLTTLSLPQIGQRLGGRDHTTVLHAVNKIKGLVENHPHLAAEIDDIKRSLGVPA